MGKHTSHARSKTLRTWTPETENFLISQIIHQGEFSPSQAAASLSKAFDGSNAYRCLDGEVCFLRDHQPTDLFISNLQLSEIIPILMIARDCPEPPNPLEEYARKIMGTSDAFKKPTRAQYQQLIEVLQEACTKAAKLAFVEPSL